MNRAGLLAVLMIISALATMHVLTGSVRSVGNTMLTVSPSQAIVDYLGADFPTSFFVNVSITDVAGLSMWHIKLLFNPSILACSNVVETPDGIFRGFETIGLGISIDNTAGYVGAYNGLWTTGGGANGSGNLCRLRFDVKQPGISSIAFTDLDVYGGTIIYGSAFPVSLPFNSMDGYVQVSAAGFQANTFQAMKENVVYNVSIFTNSTVSDFGYDGDKITYVQTGSSGSVGSCSVLIPNGLMNVSFGILLNGNAMYFTVFADGKNHFLLWTYGHSTGATVSILPTVAGDLNADRKTDMKDVAIAAYSFGSTPGALRWNPITDVNGDRKIDMKDLAFVAKCFGQRYEPT